MLWKEADEPEQHLRSGMLFMFDDGIGGCVDGAKKLLSTSARARGACTALIWRGPWRARTDVTDCATPRLDCTVVEDDDTPGKLLYYYPPSA
jgi:hypothetical protein